MKKMIAISIFSASLLAAHAQAQPADILGGPDGATQTVSHCGLLMTTQKSYTVSPATIRLVQQKLSRLGYYHTAPTGVYDRKSKLAVKQFQRDYGLKVDGAVGPVTAQRLAFETHPNPNVRRCFTTASN